MKNKFIGILVAVLLLFCGCSSGGSDNPVEPDAAEDVSGVWQGTVSYHNTRGEPINLDITLEMVQDGQNITGSCDFFLDNDRRSTEDVSGTIRDTSITTSVILGHQEDALEYVFEGDANDGTFEGNLTVHGTDDNGVDQTTTGTFTLFKAEDDPPPVQELNMSGVWQGEIQLNANDNILASTLELVQNGTAISGSGDISLNDSTVQMTDASGEIAGKNARITARSGEVNDTDLFIEIIYSGEVENGIYSGTHTMRLRLEVQGEIITRDGTFELTQQRAANADDVLPMNALF